MTEQDASVVDSQQQISIRFDVSEHAENPQKPLTMGSSRDQE
jgi:hypothetical protein